MGSSYPLHKAHADKDIILIDKLTLVAKVILGIQALEASDDDIQVALAHASGQTTLRHLHQPVLNPKRVFRPSNTSAKILGDGEEFRPGDRGFAVAHDERRPQADLEQAHAQAVDVVLHPVPLLGDGTLSPRVLV